MKRIALVTANAARELDEDMPPLQAALRAAGAIAEVTVWDDEAVAWSRYDLVLLRSTWDYTTRVGEFLAWAERVARLTRLCNPLPLLRWNIDKHYLRDLALRGIDTIPAEFVEPADSAEGALQSFLEKHPAQEFVIKPCIGAGSRDVRRHARGDVAAGVAQLRDLLATGRSALVQPYLDRVDEHGETALIFLDGQYSHAIRKSALLARKAEASRALFAAERIAARTPSEAELVLARKTLAAIPFDDHVAYARVDLLQDGSGRPHLLELELTEPSLFFAHGADAAARFAEGLLASLR